MQRIARSAARQLSRAAGPVRVLPVLRQRRPVADQSGLTARQRSANLAGALEALPGSGEVLAGGQSVLVDDVMTTGATLVEAMRAVGAAGAEVTGAAVITYRPAPVGTTRD